MGLIERFINFLKKFWFFSNPDVDNFTIEGENSAEIAEKVEEPSLKQLEEAAEVAENTVIDDKIKVVQLTLSRLYVLSQKITVFKESFPDSYRYFKDQIKELEKSYNDSLNAIKQSLTFEIDPEKDGEKLAKIMILEKDVEAFIEKEVKFDIFIKKLQKLILKLNILYNVSVMHTRPDEKNKAVIQTERAINAEKRIIREFKCCEYLMADMRIKDKMVSLISYLDYQIFKLLLRNSDTTPTEVLEKLTIMIDFEGINHKAGFEAFLEEELENFVNLIEQIQDENFKKMLKGDYKEICTRLVCSKEQNLIDIGFWNKVFTLESMLFNLLRESGIEKDTIKIKINSRLDIHLTENEVLVVPKTNAYLALMDVFSKTNDSRVSLVLKILKNIDDNVTYKEIYFLLLLFDVLDILEKIPNELIDDLEKYLKKYPYSKNTMSQKKDLVLNSSNIFEYIYVFTIEEHEQELLDLLKQLKIDFKNVDNKIFMNEIYFSGLTTVVNSLKAIKN